VGPSDGELVQRARDGDRDAFRQLVERYQRRIATLALGMLRNREDALDVVQETFTKAYQSLDRFKGDASFYTWTYRIAVNLCIDHQRRENKLPQASLEPRPGERAARAAEDPLGALPDPSEQGDPYQHTRDAEIAQGLSRAISELTPEHRAVILLREVDGLSYEEISHVLECPKGTVMSRLHYARRQLQERLRGLR
jgi:RNA polymerase sigma-70 factor, ECF subfamily